MKPAELLRGGQAPAWHQARSPRSWRHGVQSQRVKSLADLTHAIKDALASDRPHLIEISQRRFADA